MKHFQKKIFSLKQVSGLLVAVFLGISALTYAVTVPFPNFTAGTTIRASEVNQNFAALKNAVDILEAQLNPIYTQFGGLNNSSVTVSSLETALGTSVNKFTKQRADSNIEVFVNSRFSSGTFANTNGVLFSVRIDDTVLPAFQTKGAITVSGQTDFLSLYAVFPNLTSGSHTVSLWGQAVPGGSSTGVLSDPGGFSGSIIVKESGRF